MNLRNQLEQGIHGWDGKTNAQLEHLHDNLHKYPEFYSVLIALCHLPPYQNGATWLLKHSLSMGKQLSSAQTELLIQSTPQLAHWESKLHLLQCLPQLDLANAPRAQLESFIRLCLHEKHAFVRAWAYNGMALLAQHYQELEAEVQDLFASALKTESASVKARLRNIRL